MNIGINDKLDALISLTAKECGNDDVEMFNNLDTSKVSLDKHFYLKLRQIISKHKHTAAVLTIKKFFVRAAVALMALMSLGFLTIMATPDLREAVFEAVVEWYDNYISIRYEPIADDTYDTDTADESTDKSSTENPGEESSVSVTFVPPTKIEQAKSPAYLPDGVEEEVVLNNNSMISIDYYLNNAELYYTYNQIVFKNNSMLFDNDSVVIDETIIDGQPMHIVEYNSKEGKSVIWTDGFYYFQLFSRSLSVEEMIVIALSVQ